MKRFWPFRIHRSPLRTARVCIREASEPIWGSVIPIADSSSPARRGGMWRFFWASVPNRRIEIVPSVRETERMDSPGWPAAASSSSMMHWATTPLPLPPYCSG